MKPSVLLIDEDIGYRKHAADILVSRGYTVYEAASPDESKRLVENRSIDFVSIARPTTDPDAIELVHGLKSNHSDLKVSFLLDHTPGPLTELQQNQGINLALRKPTLPEELAHKITRILMLEGKGTSAIIGTTHDAVHLYAMPEEQPQPVRHESELVTLRKNYATKIPQILSEIGNKLIVAQQNPASVEAIAEAHRLAHSLHGTAGSLGFNTVFSIGGAMEHVLQEMMEIRRIASMPPKRTGRESSSARIDTRTSEIFDNTELENSSSAVISVLIVDDDPEFLSSVELMGNENLIQVHTAKTGKEAVALAKSHRMDAAIIDVYLSNKENPFQIAKELRALKGYNELPLSFISADTSIPTRIAAVHAGASQFLDKPLRSGDFAAAVRRLAPLETEDRPRVFIVDDDEMLLKHLSLILKAEGMKVDTLSDPTRILDVIHKIRPDILLLDVVMPEIGGIDVCRILRSSEPWRELPILFMTVQTSNEILLKCYQAGADDYIEKPILKEELLARINVRLERVRLYRERADRDGLTGLLTRRAFIERFKIQLAEGTRFKKPVSVCMIDLDSFKMINDTYGHLAGDRVLARFGRLLGSRFRTMDARCRWGGEEFAVSFYGEGSRTARMILQRVHEEFKEMTFSGDHGDEFQATFSAGIASFPKSGLSLEDLFPVADGKLYTAKQNGRNRIEI